MNRMTFTCLFDLRRRGPWTCVDLSAYFYLWWELFKQWHDNYFSWFVIQKDLLSRMKDQKGFLLKIYWYYKWIFNIIL